MWDGRFGGFLGFLTGKNQYPTFQGGYCPARFRVKLSLTWKAFRPFRYALYDTILHHAIPSSSYARLHVSQLFRFRSTSKVLKSDLARTFSFSLKNPRLQLWDYSPLKTLKIPLKYPFFEVFWTPPKRVKNTSKTRALFFSSFFWKNPLFKRTSFWGVPKRPDSWEHQFIQVLSSVGWPFWGFFRVFNREKSGFHA